MVNMQLLIKGQPWHDNLVVQFWIQHIHTEGWGSEEKKQGCRGRSTGLQIPPEGPATALSKYVAAVHSREESLALKQGIWSFFFLLKQQECHLNPSLFTLWSHSALGIVWIRLKIVSCVICKLDCIWISLESRSTGRTAFILCLCMFFGDKS